MDAISVLKDIMARRILRAIRVSLRAVTPEAATRTRLRIRRYLRV